MGENLEWMNVWIKSIEIFRFILVMHNSTYSSFIDTNWHSVISDKSGGGGRLNAPLKLNYA